MDIRRGLARRLVPATVVAVVVLAGGCASTEGAAVVPTSSAPAASGPAPTTTTLAGLSLPPSITEFRAACPARRSAAGQLVGLEDLASHEALWQATRPETYRYQIDIGGGERNTNHTIVRVEDGVAVPTTSSC